MIAWYWIPLVSVLCLTIGAIVGGMATYALLTDDTYPDTSVKPPG